MSLCILKKENSDSIVFGRRIQIRRHVLFNNSSFFGFYLCDQSGIGRAIQSKVSAERNNAECRCEFLSFYDLLSNLLRKT